METIAAVLILVVLVAFVFGEFYAQYGPWWRKGGKK